MVTAKHIRDILRRVDWSASLAEDAQQRGERDDANLDQQDDGLRVVHDRDSTL